MNLRDFFSRKVRDGRDKPYKYDDIPYSSDEPVVTSTPTPTEEPKVSEQDRVRTAEELADWSRVYFDHPVISDMIWKAVPDFKNFTVKQLCNAFKSVIDEYLPQEYKTTYCIELIRVVVARMFLIFGSQNSFYNDGEMDFCNEDKFRRDFLIALYKICEFYNVPFADTFQIIKGVDIYQTFSPSNDESYFLTWSFADFTYLVENGSFAIIGGRDGCVAEVKKIFRNNFGEFMILASAEDVRELYYFDIRYTLKDESLFMDCFFEAVDSCEYYNDSEVMELEAIDELVRLYPQNVSEIYTYYFNMIISRSSSAIGCSEFEDDFVGLLQRIKDQAEYRSEEFFTIKANFMPYILDVIDCFDGYALNVFVDLLVDTLGVNKDDVEEVISHYVDSFFDDYGKPFDYTSDFSWISKLLSNPLCFDIVCYYKPSIVDVFN